MLLGSGRMAGCIRWRGAGPARRWRPSTGAPANARISLSSHVLAELERVADYLILLSRGQLQVAGQVAGLPLTRLTQALRRPPPPDPLQPLSPREREVLRLIARGHSNRKIARDLAIGEQTVKTHVRSILSELGLQDRVQAAIFALRHQAGRYEHRP